MIFADIILDGENEPFANATFEHAPSPGDRVWVQAEPLAEGRTVEVVRRGWTAALHRQSPNKHVVLVVCDIAPFGSVDADTETKEKK